VRYTLAIFDFDGTLADSFPFFSSVYDRLADEHGLRRVAPGEVDALRRSGAREIMARVGLPPWKLPRVARSFVALMRENAQAVPLFPGVAEVLHALDARGVLIAIVSSNSRDNVETVLGSGNARCVKCFECGASIFGKRARIRRVLKHCGVPPSAAIYIGDQPTDLEAARKERVAFGAVSWGYGHIDSMTPHAPDAVFANVADMLSIA
jgi:phosphoglycolate phosphatase